MALHAAAVAAVAAAAAEYDGDDGDGDERKKIMIMTIILLETRDSLLPCTCRARETKTHHANKHRMTHCLYDVRVYIFLYISNKMKKNSIITC